MICPQGHTWTDTGEQICRCPRCGRASITPRESAVFSAPPKWHEIADEAAERAEWREMKWRERMGL